MTHNISLCIFDLDGVIVDTAKFHFEAWKKMARSFDFELTEELNENLKGVSRVKSLETILNWAGVAKTDEEKLALATAKNDDYIASINAVNKIEALPGVVDFILKLKSKGVKVAVGSASRNAKLILDRIGILNLFEAIVDGNMTKKGKPDPEVFLTGAKMTLCAPENTIVFEDASKGVDAALSAGMYAVGVGSLEQLGHAHVVITGFEHLDLENLTTKFE